MPDSLRDRLAVLLALATIVCLGLAFFFARDPQFLMPGPLASAHGSIETCGTCHANSGSGKLSWIGGLVAGNPLADSQACLACHKMPDTAFNAHSAGAQVLEQSTKRLSKLAAGTPVPQSARAQSAAFPTDDKVAHGLYCATCHQEHQGVNFKLDKISNEQCRSCHVVKFDSFDGHHPQFENYPFNRRSRIIYDHAGHFSKHFPEMEKKDPAKRIPATCASCHNSRDDKRVMAVAPFEQTCTACHLDQIVGKERASGPKGIAFLTLPGLDLQTLKKKRASIGEWPDASEAELTPFMKMMIGRSQRGRALIKAVESLNLQDLSRAHDDQIGAVTSLVWEVKGLFHALIKGRASDVLADLNIGGSAKLSASLIADLTASIPRDVVLGAQQQWLPNLAAEMTNRPIAGLASPQAQSGSDARQANAKRGPQPVAREASQSGRAAGEADAANPKLDSANGTLATEGARAAPAESRLDGSEASGRPSGSDTRPAAPNSSSEPTGSGAASKPRVDPQSCIVSVFGQCLVSKGPEADAVKSAGAARQADAANPKADGGKEESSTEEASRPSQARSEEAAQAAKPVGAAGKTKPANAKSEGSKEALAADERPRNRAADQTDDLLHPTEQELRGIAAPRKGVQNAAQPEGVAREPDGAADANSLARASADSGTAVAKPQTRAVPAIGIESVVDPESWAEYGGWYRQNHAIFYRPIGHKDKFIQSWLVLTGPHAPKGDRSPAAAVFDLLTGKDAQGSCAKCHSVDDMRGKGRIVNFTPLSIESKRGRFTNFIHEPHFGIMEKRGCLTCHDLEKGSPYLRSYEQGNPKAFVANFAAVKKDLCQTCHTSSMARQDCLLCHKYHVDGVTTPIMKTRIPTD